MDNEPKIRISIISDMGDEILELPPTEALAEMKRLVDTCGKWLFVDGVHTNVNRLTVEQLNSGSEYMITNLIKGG